MKTINQKMKNLSARRRKKIETAPLLSIGGKIKSVILLQAETFAKPGQKEKAFAWRRRYIKKKEFLVRLARVVYEWDRWNTPFLR
jgi:hypothetical protein